MHAQGYVCVDGVCAELLIIKPDYKMLMHILPAIHKHEGSFCMFLVGGDYTWCLYVCVPVCNFSSCWNEKCLHVDGRVCLWERSLARLSLQTVVWHSSVMKPLCPPFVFLFPSFSSSFFSRSLQCYWEVHLVWPSLMSLAFAWLCVSLSHSLASYSFIMHSTHAILVCATLAGFSCN